MNLEEIQSLANILRESGLTYLEVTEGDRTIRLERQAAGQAVPQNIPAEAQAAVIPAIAAPAAVSEVASDLKEIKSPLVGVFYASPSPESEPFVQMGSKVKKGDVLCVIEAMKLLNELNSDVEGEIAEICVGNGQIVEYGQTLFKVR